MHLQIYLNHFIGGEEVDINKPCSVGLARNEVFCQDNYHRINEKSLHD